MKTQTWFVVGLVVGVVAIGRPADASLFMSISDGAVTVSCTNPPNACGAGWNTPGVNIMTFTGTVGSYSVALSSTATNNPGSPMIAQVDTSDTSVRRETFLSATTLTILISQDGFTEPSTSSAFLGNTGSASFAAGIAGDNYSVQSWVDTTNALHTTTPVAGPGVTTAGPCSVVSPGGTVGSQACTNPLVAFANVVPFSLTQQLTYFIATAATRDDTINSTGVSAVTSAVPEPASLTLLGVGLLGLVRRLRKRTAQ